MSDLHDRNSEYRYLRGLSVDELLCLLRQKKDATLGRLTERHYTMIEEVVLEKEKESPSGRFRNVDEAWADFVRDRLPEAEAARAGAAEERKGSRLHRRPAKLIALAAALAVLVVAMALVSGAETGFFNKMARWTQELFAFGEPVSEENKNTVYREEIQEYLRKIDMDISLAPAWYPAGCEMQKPQISTGNIGNSLDSTFFGDNLDFGIQFVKYMSGTNAEQLLFEKDKNNVIEYESNGRVFYIVSNLDTTTATWSDGLQVVSVYGHLSMDDLTTLIDSIGE